MGPGEYKYLADARVQAIYQAARVAAMEQAQVEDTLPYTDDVVPLSAEAALFNLMNGFTAVSPSQPPRPMGRPRYTLLGAGHKQT